MIKRKFLMIVMLIAVLTFKSYFVDESNNLKNHVGVGEEFVDDYGKICIEEKP